MQVRLDAVDPRVYSRLGDPGQLQQVEEGVLVAALGPGAAGGVERQRLLEDFEVVAPVGSCDRVVRGGEAEAPAERGFVDHVRELMGGEHVGQVHEHAGDRGDRDVLVVVTSRGSRVGARWIRVAVCTRRRCGTTTSMREARKRDTCQSSPQARWLSAAPLPASSTAAMKCRLARERDVPDGVHAGATRMQPAAHDPARDRVAIEPRREQLRQRHEPVLARGQRRDLRVHRGGWGTKAAVFERFVPHPPNLVPGA